MSLRSVCVFCGANPNPQSLYKATAQAMGQLLAERGICLIYGGGSSGLMGALADAALAAGGEVIGVSCADSNASTHTGLSRLEVLENHAARKVRIAELADAYVALPGSLGTLSELFEMWSWAQLGYHRKPLGLLEVNSFYSKLTSFLGHKQESAEAGPAQARSLIVANDSHSMLEALNNWQPVAPPQWLQRTAH